MKENRVQENISSNFIQVCHVEGKVNMADISTKEMNDTSHFVELFDLIMCLYFLLLFIR